MEKKAVNYQILLRGIILLGFALLTFKLLITNTIGYLIAPKMNSFMYFTAGTLLVLSIYYILSATSEKDQFVCQCDHHRPSKSRLKSFIYYTVFIFPILSGFLFFDHTIGTSVAIKRHIYLGETTNQLSNQHTLSPLSETWFNYMDGLNKIIPFDSEESFIGYELTEVDATEPPKPLSESEYVSLQETMIQQESFVIDDYHYVPMMGILKKGVIDFVGKEIETVGFIYREEGFSYNQVAIARFAMSCCVADATAHGLVAEGDVTKLKNDTWVRVKGIIDTTEYNKGTVPVLKITSIEKISEPEQPYVYNIGIVSGG